MSRPEQTAPTGERTERKSVPCAKCRTANPPGSNTCRQCGAHLWVVCHHCGHRNQRVEARCEECDRRLHRSLWKRASKRLFPDKQKVPVWQIALLILGIWIAYRIVVYVAEFRLPQPN